MPKQQKSKIGGNKAKSRRSSRHAKAGYYAQRFDITERNRKRKRLKHLSVHPADRQTLALLKDQLR